MSSPRMLLVALLASALVIAGCIDAPPETPDGLTDPVFSDLFARGEPLWHAPQDFPHPAFGWPTLTNPPAGENIPHWWKPIPAAELPESISGISLHGSSLDVDEEYRLPAGAGFAAFGSLVSMPTWDQSTYIVDISDVTEPKILSEIEISTRGAVMIPYPDGRLITVYATSGDLLVYDITDPENPEDLGALGVSGSHKVGVVPGTPIVYNAGSSGGGAGAFTGEPTGVTEIFDLSDPDNPEHVMDFENGYSCHHIYFHVNPELDQYYGICAGIEMTQIFDITDPRDPEVVSEISMPLGNTPLGDAFPSLAVSPAMLSHFSILSHDGTVLIVGDETGGGAAPACDVYAHAAGTTVSGPIGNLFFYDVSDFSNPQLLSWMSPTHHFPTNPPVNDDGVAEQGGFGYAGCTAHHGRLVPDPEGRDMLAMAFYGAGTVLIDFSDASNPWIVDQFNDNTNTWEVWYYNGHLITGDLSRGMDILVFE